MPVNMVEHGHEIYVIPGGVVVNDASVFVTSPGSKGIHSEEGRLLSRVKPCSKRPVPAKVELRSIFFLFDFDQIDIDGVSLICRAALIKLLRQYADCFASGNSVSAESNLSSMKIELKSETLVYFRLYRLLSIAERQMVREKVNTLLLGNHNLTAPVQLYWYPRKVKKQGCVLITENTLTVIPYPEWRTSWTNCQTKEILHGL